MSRPLFGAPQSPERRELDEAIAVLDRLGYGPELGSLLDQVAQFLDFIQPGDQIGPAVHDGMAQACADAIGGLRTIADTLPAGTES